jgi:quinol monooxygenase YgiN
MWIRLIEVKIQSDKLDEARTIYNEEITPTVKTQKGNVDMFLMESMDRENEVVSFTSWDNQEDGDAYEASGTYVEMVNKVKHTFVGSPTLWSYDVKK